jgi:hypothetical protein
MEHSGDEGLGQRYGPKRIALWFDEAEGYRENNERIWRIRRTLIKSELWNAYEFPDVPLVPEWFGMLLPFDLAYRESGHPVIWCSMLGFPSLAIRDRALRLIERERPPGLLRIEKSAPDPTQYSLPIVGFLAKGSYLTLEPEHPRYYDSWRGYETLGLFPDEESGLLEVLTGNEAERLLLRRLALSASRWLDSPQHRSKYDAVVHQARELWALGASVAAGAVAGTAMEALLAESLRETDEAWVSAKRRTLKPLLDRAAKRHGISEEQVRLLDEFRQLRNECAHASRGFADDGTNGLAERVAKWLDWLEEQDFEHASARLRPVRVKHARPSPSDLHARADAAGHEAAEAVTPVPMGLRSADGEAIVEEEGACGFGIVVVRPRRDPLAKWLVESNLARPVRGGVRRSIMWRTQSLDRATAYARAYVGVLREFDIDAYYESQLD